MRCCLLSQICTVACANRKCVSMVKVSSISQCVLQVYDSENNEDGDDDRPPVEPRHHNVNCCLAIFGRPQLGHFSTKGRAIILPSFHPRNSSCDINISKIYQPLKSGWQKNNNKM